LIAKRIEREKEKKCKTGATRKQEKHKKNTCQREKREKKVEKKTDPAHFSPNCTDPAHFALPLFCEKALKTSDTRQNAS
jgi:hypothetical protein